MTDKEFKELCNWAKSIDENVIITDRYVELGNLYYYKDGTIYSEGIMARSRTQKQIKAIIKNLVGEAEV